MSNTRKLVLGFAAATLALAGRADEGRIPIHKSTIVAQTGSYVLTRDVAVSSGEAIRVDADGVTLDLNGHAVSVDGAGSAVVIGPEVTSFTLRNGKLLGGNNGVSYAAGANRARIRVESVEILHPGTYGVFAIGAASLEIRSVHVVGAGMDGIYADGGAGPLSARLLDNTVEDATGDGIYLRGLRGGEVRRNVVVGHAEAGIDLVSDGSWPGGGNVLEGNTVRGGGAASVGIRIDSMTSNNLLTANVVSSNGAQGILVGSAGNRLAENESSGNGQDGVRVDGANNLVERNVLTGNAAGLRMGCNGSRYRDNMLVGNLTIYCTGSCCGTANAGGNLY